MYDRMVLLRPVGTYRKNSPDPLAVGGFGGSIGNDTDTNENGSHSRPVSDDPVRFDGVSCVTEGYLFARSDTTYITNPGEVHRTVAMTRKHIMDEDEGKRVVDSGGHEVGMITEVRSGTAYVEADPGLADTIRSKLGWNKADHDDYPLESDSIDVVTDEEIRLLDNF